MKISVKQGRLMAVMAAMILIIGIFVVGKMLGYGSANNRYLLEGYKEGNVEVVDEPDDEKEEEESTLEEIAFTDGKKKGKKETFKEGAGHTTVVSDLSGVVQEEGFSCGSKIANYDDKDDVYAAF